MKQKKPKKKKSMQIVTKEWNYRGTIVATMIMEFV